MAKKQIEVEALRHKDKRGNIPTAELEPVMDEKDKSPIRLAYERRNRDLDPQLVWRGKDEQNWSDLIVQAPPLYIQEKVHPKVLIDDLLRQRKKRREEATPPMPDLFADFNGLPDKEALTEFYRHDANWSNRMILGDSLSVMASLAEREGLRGQVQCIYIDPPYGIRFNSNFQWSTTTRDVKDGNKGHITREPEQVKAFRDTWRDGIHSYLTYLRDRLTVARELLADRGSIFVQIGDENIHRVRALMDEVFGDSNFISQLSTKKSGGSTGEFLAGIIDYVVWYAKNKEAMKFRELYRVKALGTEGAEKYNRIELPNLERRSLGSDEKSRNIDTGRCSRMSPRQSNQPERRPRQGRRGGFLVPVELCGLTIRPSLQVRWKTNETGMDRLLRANRVEVTGGSLAYVRYLDDFGAISINNLWDDIGGVQSRADPKIYVVQSATGLIQRCVLMATDPGDLVLDPTCGSGTTAYVAEQWGRRWITIDTFRVALALARARIMGARYPYYLLADSPEGQRRESKASLTPPKETPTHNDIRQGFVCKRVPHMTLKSIANNAEIDVIWEKWQATLEPLRARLNAALGESWKESAIPRDDNVNWSGEGRDLRSEWWQARIARQKEIDASIARKPEFEYLYDKPYTDNSRKRVAGPFTVESLSPHRVVAVDQDDSLILGLAETGAGCEDFGQMVFENLKTSGVQQAHKEDRITFTTLTAWPGRLISAEGHYSDGEQDRRAAILIGPEFGIVSRPDLVDAAREAADDRFDVLIACAFNFDVRSTELDRVGRIPILKARMNPDLHMAGELKNTGAGNLFVVFGEPDIQVEPVGDDQIRVKIDGVDVFKPQTGEIESGGPDTIALWFIDTDYNEESFFVRHAYFLGAATDPYKALKTTLRAEIDEEAWASLRSDTSRPFAKPKSGRIAVKVINHLGNEVMKVFAVR